MKNYFDLKADDLRGISHEQYSQLINFMDDLVGRGRYGFAGFEDRTAIVMIRPFSKEMSIKGYDEPEFHDMMSSDKAEMVSAASKISEKLSELGVGLEIPQASQTDDAHLMAPLSFKNAAVLAGLGFIGKSDIFISYTYGARVRLNAVLADFSLPSLQQDPDYTEPLSLCGDCQLCVKACPHGCIRGVNWTPSTPREELIDYHRCSQKRLRPEKRKYACGLCMLACNFAR